jgi:formylglycine-generating enzyme required for sulfatase activity
MPDSASRELGPMAVPTAEPSAGAPENAPPLAPAEDLAAWDAAGAVARAECAAAIAARMPEVVFEGLRALECGSQRHEIAVFRHTRTGIEMCLVPGGVATYEVGDDDAGANQRSARTPPFLVARTEVTNATWSCAAGGPASGADGDLPVTASYDEAAAFCARSGLELPSSAQWERAARGGAPTRFCHGDDAGAAHEYGWLLDNSGRRLHAVAGKRPNAFGLFDVIGNAREWCSVPAEDPSALEARGSGFDRRASARVWRVPRDRASSRFGLRPVLAVRDDTPIAAARR